MKRHSTRMDSLLIRARRLGLTLPVLGLVACGGGSGGGEPEPALDMLPYLVVDSEQTQQFDLYLGDSGDAIRVPDYETRRWRSTDNGIGMTSDGGDDLVIRADAAQITEFLVSGEQRHWPRSLPAGSRELVRTSSVGTEQHFLVSGPAALVTLFWHGTPLRGYSNALRLLSWSGDTLTVDIHAPGRSRVASLTYDACPRPSSLSSDFDPATYCGYPVAMQVLVREIYDAPDPGTPDDDESPVDPDNPDTPPDPAEPGPEEPEQPADPDDPAEPTDPADPADPDAGVELPRLILVRHAPSPEPGEGEQPPDEEVLPPLDMAALLLPAASGTQTFDAFDFYDGQRLVFAADLQLSWQEQEDGSWRYVDSAGDSATFLVTDTNVRVMPDEGGEIRYPRWPAGDDVMPYSIENANSTVTNRSLFLGGPYWSVTVWISEQHQRTFDHAAVAVRRMEDADTGEISMDIGVYAPGYGRVATLVWQRCDSELPARPAAAFAEHCDNDIYAELLAAP